MPRPELGWWRHVGLQDGKQLRVEGRTMQMHLETDSPVASAARGLGRPEQATEAGPGLRA